MVVEAIQDNSTGIIVSYHPPIFPSVSSLTLRDPIQRALLQCASAGIAVYSPHTALDAVKGGVNDWLASGIVDRLGTACSLTNIRDIPGEELIAGHGRKVSFERPVLVDDVVRCIKTHLGIPHGGCLKPL